MSPVSPVERWLETWPQQQARVSDFPLDHWQRVARAIMQDRLALGNDPLLPVNRYALSWPDAMEHLVGRNTEGIHLERQGQVDDALFIYEQSIADEFPGIHPYDRLRVIYTRRHQYADAIRVCQAFLAAPDRAHRNASNQEHFRHHLEQLTAKHDKAPA